MILTQFNDLKNAGISEEWLQDIIKQGKEGDPDWLWDIMQEAQENIDKNNPFYLHGFHDKIQESGHTIMPAHIFNDFLVNHCGDDPITNPETLEELAKEQELISQAFA